MPAPRPCLGPVDRRERCPELALPDKDRCELHYVPRKPTPSGRITQTSRWRRLRRQFIAESPRPWRCSICGREITDEKHIEVDHVKEIAVGGDPWDESNWALAHRICNRRKKARTPHPGRRNVAPWMLD